MIWKRSRSFPDYEVSENGEVRRCVDSRSNISRSSMKAGYVLKGTTRKDGYVQYHLSKDSVPYSVEVHILVLEEFVGPKPSIKHQGAHNDGKPWHNHFTNLRWDTAKGNHADLQKHGTATKGIRNGRAKLTEADVVAIRREFEETKPYESGGRRGIAKRYGIALYTLYGIANKKLWPHVS